ncbi:MAG: transcription termination/antitermination protein NusG [Pirellulaceae bacterium]
MVEENKTVDDAATRSQPDPADAAPEPIVAEVPEVPETPDVEPVTEQPQVPPVADAAEASEVPVEADEGSEPQATEFDESELLDDDYVDEDLDEDEDAAPLESLVEEAPEVEEISMDWFILKVQVNRENSICDALMRRVKVAGLERFFGEILVPTEDVREFTKSGKQRIVKRKLYPGYIVVNMSINDDSWFLVRETPGIGDFTGAAGKPAPLSTEEINRIVASTKPETVKASEESVKTAIKFREGDRVRVKEGYFQNYEGEVSNIDERNGRVTVMINIFGRPNPVELDHWQMEDL